MIDSYDVIVLGAGSTGEVLAGRTQDHGLSTLILENHLAGGECSYYACMPSKAMLRPSALLEAARRVPGAREAITGNLDTKAVLAERYETVSKYDDSSQMKWLESVKVAAVRGTARISGIREVTVDLKDGGTQVFTANKAVVVATGSLAVVPPIEGLKEIEPWTSREATSATEVPRRLAVIGGGYVGAEMAQAWKQLGCEQVTMLVRGTGLLDKAEPFAATAVAVAFEKMSIDIRFETEVKKVEKSGSITLTLNNGSTLEVDQVLVAVGRKPTTEDIGLDVVGLDPGKPIDVDDQLRAKGVDGGWLYAAGDVNGRSPLTHMGKYQARLCADAIAGQDVNAFADHTAVPSVVFTDPQVAQVGMTLNEAKVAGISAREVRVKLSSAAGAYINKEDGDAQMVVDESRKVIVGATFVGPEVGEMLHAATIAIVGGVTLDQLWHAVPSYPTVSEVWLRLLEEYGL